LEPSYDTPSFTFWPDRLFGRDTRDTPQHS
jgi:hypothetical protein